MAIGDKIQSYRKALGMSQEELGQKLFVSRQTISLWEKGQTVPTIENLIRLKEIFGVPVDKILDDENHMEENADLPLESYQFSYSKNELAEIYKYTKNRLLKQMILFFILYLVLLFFCIGASASQVVTGIVIGILLVGSISHIKGILTLKKARSKKELIIAQSTYEYRIYRNYFIVSIHRSAETVRTAKVYFQDVEQMQDIGKYLLLVFSGQSFVLKKADLSGDSVFYALLKKHSAKAVPQTLPHKWKILSVILFAGSLLSIFGAMLLQTLISNKNHLFVENMWVFFVLTPIPIASIIFGYVLKKKGFKYKKNVVAGIIMAVLLCIYGSFSFLFSNIYNHSDALVTKFEQYTKTEIPAYEQIHTQDWTQGTQTSETGYIYYTSDVYFGTKDAEEFETQIALDSKWLSSLPNDMVGIASPFGGMPSYDYILIYNMDSDAYNKLPAENGVYHFISAFYHAENNRMFIVEYEINYIK